MNIVPNYFVDFGGRRIWKFLNREQHIDLIYYSALATWSIHNNPRYSGSVSLHTDIHLAHLSLLVPRGTDRAVTEAIE